MLRLCGLHVTCSRIVLINMVYTVTKCLLWDNFIVLILLVLNLVSNFSYSLCFVCLNTFLVDYLRDKKATQEQRDKERKEEQRQQTEDWEGKIGLAYTVLK